MGHWVTMSHLSCYTELWDSEKKHNCPTIWNVKVVRDIVSRLSLVLCMVETGDDCCQRASLTYHTLRDLSSEDRQKHQRKRNAITLTAVTRLLNDWMVNHARTTRQNSSDTRLHCGKSIRANWFLLMCDTREVNHWFITRWTMNHLNIQVFFLLFTKPRLLFSHNLLRKRGNLCIIRAHDAFLS